MNTISYNKAIDITHEFASEIVSVFNDKIIAVFAIGSLGSDYYRPGQSDIDTAVIVDVPRNEIWDIKNYIRSVADKYFEKYNVPKGFGAIVFSKDQLYPPYIRNEELILEILRLKTQSKIVYGSFNLNDIPFPEIDAIIEDARAFEEWADSMRKNDPYFKINDTVSLVNSTLMILRRYLLIKCGICEFNKFKTISLYLSENPPIIFNELFDYVEKYIRDESCPLCKSSFQNFIEQHDTLYKHINSICL